MRRRSIGTGLRVALGLVALALVGCQGVQTAPASATPTAHTSGSRPSPPHSGPAHSAAAKTSTAPALDGGPAQSAGRATPPPISSSPQPAPAAGLKPPIQGFIYLQGTPPASERLLMGGYDIEGKGGDYGDVSWAELQPAEGGPIAADNPIDQAITEVRAWNAANPTHHESLLLRVAAGVHSPAWALNLGGPCVEVTDPVFNLTGCTPRFWTPQYGAAFYQFETELAAKYDSVPEIGEVVIARDMTFYNEPMLRQITSPSSVANLLAAGYTTSLDEQNQRNDIVELGTYWKHTRVGYTFNPYESLNPVGYSETFTAQLMAYGRQVLGDHLVLDNDSARIAYIDEPGYFSQMFASMQSLGTPIGYQTAVLKNVGDLLTTIQGLIALGAGNIELPPGFDTVLTLQQLTALDLTFIRG
jgi:hypothetical protein